MNDTVSKWSGNKYRLFALLTVISSIAVSLMAVELVLRYQDNHIARSEQMETGLIGFDTELGWKLTPGWSGSHRHHDFNVNYNIGLSGFRNDEQQKQGSGPRIAVLGDSFTFGLGVNDNETFVSLLNAADDTQGEFINLGVPGYSTDQEYLLLQKTGPSIKPDRVLLVVYLANDLFDNSLAFPLQADHAKPFFTLDKDDKLVAKNTPVPRASKSAAARKTSLAGVVLGDEQPATTLLAGTLGKTHIARRLGLFQQHETLPDTVFQQRFDTYIRLFVALLQGIQETNRAIGADTLVALLPGASYINQPQSLSAQYQEYLRERLLGILVKTPDVAVIDLATAMREASDKTAGFYFPNEGHLNARGHRFVSRILASQMGK